MVRCKYPVNSYHAFLSLSAFEMKGTEQSAQPCHHHLSSLSFFEKPLKVGLARSLLRCGMLQAQSVGPFCSVGVKVAHPGTFKSCATIISTVRNDTSCY